MSLGLPVDVEVFRLDSIVRWLDAADGRIKRAAAPETAAADRAIPDQPQSPLPRLRTPSKDHCPMTMIELHQVSKSYGHGDAEVHALHEVNLAAIGGEMVAVMGPSGSESLLAASTSSESLLAASTSSEPGK